MVVHFKIDHLDQFGQGVYKRDSEVFFIPKTLPGEEGEARILKKKKGVHFCQLQKIDLPTQSLSRKTAECPHFANCSGCHYLHVDYKEEIAFKHKTLERIISYWQKKDLLLKEGKEIELVPSPERFQYRNRMQLHYDEKTRTVGLVQENQRLLAVPQCRLPDQKIQEFLKRFYENNGDWFWKKRKELQQPPAGHVELALHGTNGDVRLIWNDNYASGGFSQVNQGVNALVHQTLWTKFQENFLGDPGQTGKLEVMDLFGGQGNLSQQLMSGKNTRASSIIVADLYKQTPDTELSGAHKRSFQHLNLYNPFDIKTLLKVRRKINLLIVDPPRSGWTYLSEFCQKVRPETIFYLSCDPQTLGRDLLPLHASYEMTSVHLFDMFPGTFHLETLVILQRKIS